MARVPGLRPSCSVDGDGGAGAGGSGAEGCVTSTGGGVPVGGDDGPVVGGAVSGAGGGAAIGGALRRGGGRAGCGSGDVGLGATTRTVGGDTRQSRVGSSDEPVQPGCRLTSSGARRTGRGHQASRSSPIGRPSLVSRSITFAGLRGVCKTVLLGELAGRAPERGWLVVQVEAKGRAPSTSAAPSLASWRSGASPSKLVGAGSEKVKEALGSITSFQAKVGVEGVSLGVERLPGRADSGRIQFDLVDLAEIVGRSAQEDTIGVLILIEEMQELTEEQMSAVCRSCHRPGSSIFPGSSLGLLAEPAVEARRGRVVRRTPLRLPDHRSAPARRPGSTRSQHPQQSETSRGMPTQSGSSSTSRGATRAS